MKANNTLILYPLAGSAAGIKDYAETIALYLSPKCSNAYVMAIDDDNEILWCVQAGDELSLEDCKITPEVARVEIYDHSYICEGKPVDKMEQVYLRAGARGQRSLAQYIDLCHEAGYVADNFENHTKLVADFDPALF